MIYSMTITYFALQSGKHMPLKSLEDQLWVTTLGGLVMK